MVRGRGERGDPHPRRGALQAAAIRSYRSAYEKRIEPELGGHRLADLDRADLQVFVNKLKATDLHASTIGGTFDVLRVIYRHAVGEVHANPTTGVRLPRIRSAKRRIVPPGQVGPLLAALPAADRPLWATGFYAGLRRGELQARHVEDVDLAAAVIRVRHGWDPVMGDRAEERDEPAGRPAAGRPARLPRRAPARVGVARSTGRADFGREPRSPFAPLSVAQRAKRSWKAASLQGLSMHETRHAYASFMIAAMIDAGRINMKALSRYMGHASVGITQDLYGHLLPDHESEHAEIFDAFMTRAATGERIQQLAS